MLINDLVREYAVGILLEDPLQQIVHVVEVVIEGLAVDAADLHQILDGDLLDGLDGQHLLERRAERLFGRGCHHKASLLSSPGHGNTFPLRMSQARSASSAIGVSERESE